jgi:hypothetical protein
MVETARALAAGVSGKCVVLTGAMIPYAFGSSDGLFNLGSALSYAQVLPPGVYIAMNGICFNWDNVRKNRESGVFEALRYLLVPDPLSGALPPGGCAQAQTRPRRARVGRSAALSPSRMVSRSGDWARCTEPNVPRPCPYQCGTPAGI